MHICHWHGALFCKAMDWVRICVYIKAPMATHHCKYDWYGENGLANIFTSMIDGQHAKDVIGSVVIARVLLSSSMRFVSICNSIMSWPIHLQLFCIADRDIYLRPQSIPSRQQIRRRFMPRSLASTTGRSTRMMSLESHMFLIIAVTGVR